MRLTKNCIHPWKTVCFTADGTVTPCCAAIEGDYGNIYSDYFDRIALGEASNLFVNQGYQQLRHALLTGDLLPGCRDCRVVPGALISVEDLETSVRAFLSTQGILMKGQDLTKLYAFQTCMGAFTNKCNFSCIYCIHSVFPQSSASLDLNHEMDPDSFFQLITFLTGSGLQELILVGIGELTHYPDWVGICDRIFTEFPELKICLTTNFGILLGDPELATMSRFDTISVSCDTIDPKLYARLRRGGRLPVLMENLHRLQTWCQLHNRTTPKIVLNIVMSDVVISGLEDISRFAVNNGFYLNFSNLYTAPGSAADRASTLNRVTDLDDSELPRIWDLIHHLPRRIKAENPISDIWELGSFYENVHRKVSTLTTHEFVPEECEEVYRDFASKHPNRKDAFLRKIYKSFDEHHRGILLLEGAIVELKLAPGDCWIRPIWCQTRKDGNLTYSVGDALPLPAEDSIAIAFPNGTVHVNAVLVEILPGSLDGRSIEPGRIMLEPPSDLIPDCFAWERTLIHEADETVRSLLRSCDSVAVWCAGARTLSLFQWTCLAKAPIAMIVDLNACNLGRQFAGHALREPDALHSFEGPILVAHATHPFEVEKAIRGMGFLNEIYII